MVQPLVLDIKSNSLDDGPGIRSAVFFKGCPLSCIWCHNPESKRIENEISYDKELCIGCGLCIEKCSRNALSHNNEFYIDRSKCGLCYTCVDVCPAKAITRVGQEWSMDDLLKKLLSDKTFYDISGGGVTLSGGEATMCMEWVGLLAKKLKEAGVHVLLETCGMFSYQSAEEHLLPYLGHIYCDLKIFDSDAHKKYCGVGNELILENIARMQRDQERFGFTFMPRTPLIPGITDTDENLRAIAEFEQSIGVKKTQILPYNPTWYSKTEKIGVEVDERLSGIKTWQSKDIVEHAKSFFLERGIEAK